MTAHPHILMLPSWFPTPADPFNGIFCWEHARALQEDGFRVGVVFPELRNPRGWRAGRGLSQNWGQFRTRRWQGLVIHYWHGWAPPKLLWGRASLFYRAARRLTRAYVHRHGLPDIIQAHGALWAGMAAEELAHRYAIPWVVTEHFSGFLRGTLPIRYERMGERAWAQANRATAVSGVLRHRMEEAIGRPSVALTPNPVAADLSSGPISRAEEGGTRWLALGRLVPDKGFRRLLAAFARAFGGRSDVQLAIGGQGPLRRELACLAAEWGVAEQVRFLGPLDRAQVGEALARADFFVHASQWETFGLVLLEALAAGVPVVAVDSGGPRDFVTPGRGQLVQPASVPALAEAMTTMQAERGVWEARRPEIRRAILAQYGRSAVAACYRRIYAPLLTDSERGAS